MNHAEAHSHLPDYLEGDLDLTRRALLDAHLDGCPACSREFAEMRRTIDLLRSLPDPEPPPFLVESVMGRVRQGEGRRGFAERLRDWLGEVTSPQVAIPATVLAIGLLMVSGIVDPASLLPIGFDREVPPTARVQVVSQDAVPDRNVQEVINRIQGSFQPSRVFPVMLGGSPPVPGPAPRVKIDVQQNGVTRVYVNDRSPGPRTLMRWPRSVQSPDMPYLPSPAYPMQASNAVTNVGMQTNVSSFATQPQSEVERARALAADLDRRLDNMTQRPVAFASQFESLAPVEQALWLEALSGRAVESGRGDQVLQALRRSGDRRALKVATAFATQLRQAETGSRAPATSAVQEASSAEVR